MRLHPAALAALLLLLTVSGCDDDEEQERRVTRFDGQLVFVGDESPLPDLAVTLFEPTAQVAMGKTVSDEEGRFEFVDFPPGSYVPVVHADGYRPIFLHQARWNFEEGDQFSVTIRLRETLPMPGEDFTLNCRVMEQAADPPKPIPNARAEMNFGAPGELAEVNWSEYVGWSNTLEATSDADGMLALTPVQLIYLPGGGSFVPEFRVAAPGYRSRVVPANDDPATAEVSLTVIRLVPGTDDGRITGTVRGAQGEPLAGVPVSAEWRRVSEGILRGLEPASEPAFPQRLLIPDGVAWTGEDGSFEITGLPQGFYNVLAGPYPDDGWVGFILRGVEIDRFTGVGAADLAGFAAVVPVTPADGAVLESIPARIEWEPVEGATRYLLILTRDGDGNTSTRFLDESYLDVDPGANFFKVGQTFAWTVEARDAEGQGLSITDRPQVFHIVDPARPD